MNLFKKISRYAFSLAFLYAVFVAPALAVDTGGTNPADPGGTNPGGTTGVTLVNPLKVDNLQDLLNIILDAVIYLGTIVLVIMLVWVGFLFVKAQGKPEELTKARQAFIWTIIGGLILLGARGIMTVIQSTANTL